MAGLSADAASAVGPLLAILDELVGRLERHGEESGELDGYDGTTHLGDFDRLLMEEWLLAEEVPEEFLRRAAERELTFLRVAHRANAPQGRVVAVLDTGPEQLGVARLVQLAALVVLHRRAAEAGSELSVMLLGSSSAHAAGPIVAGPAGLSSALRIWLAARSTHVPTAEEVAAAFESTDDHDRVWLLGGATARRHAPPAHRRVVSSQVVRWDHDGAGRLGVRVGDSRVEIEVPDRRAAVAALRGEGAFRRARDPSLTLLTTTGRGAVFHSADTRMLWRGESDSEVMGCFVSSESTVKRYQFKGAVLAANSLGKRVVAAVTDGRTVWIEVIGKSLARTDRIHVPVSDLGLDASALAAELAEPLAPLHLQATAIVARLGGGWWGFEGERCWLTSMAAVAPGPALDNPQAAYETSTGGIWVGGDEIDEVAAHPLLGPAVSDHASPWLTWSSDSRVWRIAHAGEVVAEIAVEERDRVVGLGLSGASGHSEYGEYGGHSGHSGQDEHSEHSGHSEHSEYGGARPYLLVTSASGRLVRQMWPDKVRTWTRWAGPAHFSLHPHRPWLARTTESRITVGDLDSGETLLELSVSL